MSPSLGQEENFISSKKFKQIVKFQVTLSFHKNFPTPVFNQKRLRWKFKFKSHYLIRKIFFSFLSLKTKKETHVNASSLSYYCTGSQRQSTWLSVALDVELYPWPSLLGLVQWNSNLCSQPKVIELVYTNIHLSLDPHTVKIERERLLHHTVYTRWIATAIKEKGNSILAVIGLTVFLWFIWIYVCPWKIWKQISMKTETMCIRTFVIFAVLSQMSLWFRISPQT